MKGVITLGEFIIERQQDFRYASGDLSKLLSAIRLASKVVNREVNQAGLVDIIGEVGSENIQGEKQQKLDVFADDVFHQALKNRGEICGVGSEERENFVAFEDERCKNGKYVVLIDPLDGSSNIDVNVSIGTIFSIYRRVSPVGEKAQIEDFLQKGRQQVAAGYIVYGSSTILVFTTGNGVNGFTYDPSIGVYYLSHPNMRFPEDGNIYSINEGNYIHFPEGVKKYIKYCQEEDKDSNRPYTSRYIGSFVSDFHRNMIKGGIYIYPSTSSSPKGKLRLLYECNPFALIAEQSGGVATDGFNDILDIEPSSLHERSPLFIGSKKMVATAMEFMEKHK